MTPQLQPAISCVFARGPTGAATVHRVTSVTVSSSSGGPQRSVTRTVSAKNGTTTISSKSSNAKLGASTDVSLAVKLNWASPGFTGAVALGETRQPLIDVFLKAKEAAGSSSQLLQYGSHPFYTKYLADGSEAFAVTPTAIANATVFEPAPSLSHQLDCGEVLSPTSDPASAKIIDGLREEVAQLKLIVQSPPPSPTKSAAELDELAAARHAASTLREEVAQLKLIVQSPPPSPTKSSAELDELAAARHAATTLREEVTRLNLIVQSPAPSPAPSPTKSAAELDERAAIIHAATTLRRQLQQAEAANAGLQIENAGLRTEIERLSPSPTKSRGDTRNSSPDSTFVNVGMPPAMTSLSSSSQGSGSDSEDDKDWQMVQSEATEPKELRRRSSTSRVVLRKWPSTSTVTGTSPGKRPETMLQQIVKQVVYTRKSTQL